jgi:hypothetical protein
MRNKWIPPLDKKFSEDQFCQNFFLYFADRWLVEN